MTQLKILEKEDAGTVIQISSHPRWRRVYELEGYTLLEARKFLGHNFFSKAACAWSIEELQRTVNHPQCGFTDAFDAYSAILRFRLNRLAPAAPIIPLKEAA
jgi:hypothetical protein